MPADWWPHLSELPRLRTEHRIVNSIKEGKYSVGAKRCVSGGLATWAGNVIKYFTLKEEFWEAVVRKLGSKEVLEQEYVLQYWLRSMDDHFDAPSLSLVFSVKLGLRAGDVRFKRLVDSWQYGELELRAPDHPWVEPFREELSKYVEAQAAAGFPADEIPF